MAKASLAAIESLFDSFTGTPQHQMTVTDSAGIVLLDSDPEDGADPPAPPHGYNLALPLLVTFSTPAYDPLENEVSRMGG